MHNFVIFFKYYHPYVSLFYGNDYTTISASFHQYFKMVDRELCILLCSSSMEDHHISHLSQVGGNLDGKFDEGSANLILDTKPSKVVSNELTVS